MDAKKYKWDLSLPSETKIPNHIGLIPDGNRRWAQARGLPAIEGHKKGFEAAVKVTRACWEIGIHTVSLWFFSTENWNRSKKEVAHLMKIYDGLIKDLLKDAKKYGVRMVHLGRKERIPKWLVKTVQKAEEKTKKARKHILNFCLDYGGHDEILRATKKMLEEKIDPNKLTKEIFESYLDTKNQSHLYPDLIIRTSGEQRLSGFMSWQNVYSELYFEKNHFPDLNPANLKRAILDYSRRKRRFGGN